MFDNITKDSKKLFCTLYKVYLERRKSGLSKGDARQFGDSHEIRNAYFPDDLEEDITDSCWELHRCEYVTCGKGDDLANDVTLTDSGIVCMEQRFKNGIVDVVKFIADLIP